MKQNPRELSLSGLLIVNLSTDTYESSPVWKASKNDEKGLPFLFSNVGKTSRANGTECLSKLRMSSIFLP